MTSPTIHFQAHNPDAGHLQDIRGTEYLPSALHSHTEQPMTALTDLAEALEGDAVIHAGE